MTRTIPESDWKVYRQLHSVVLNRFCERVLAELAEIAGDLKATPHERYLRIYNRVDQRNRTMAQAFDDLRRSTALQQILIIHSHGLITEDETGRFTQDTRDLISHFSTPSD